MKKTRVERRGNISSETLTILKNHMKDRQKSLKDQLFDETVNALRLKINRKLSAAGFNYTTHDFRHARITELSQKGLSIKAIQNYVGHQNPATTMRYIH